MDPLLAAAFVAFGLAFGSFLNVCIHRMPRRILARDELDELQQQAGLDPGLGEAAGARIAGLRAEVRSLSIARGRSACPGCGAAIAWYDNVPVLSWLWLRGRCRRCRAPISPRYLAVELLTALLFLGCYWRFGATPTAAKLCALSFFLLGLIFTDAEHKLLPDALTLPGLGVGLLFSAFVPMADFATGFLAMFVGPGYLPSPASMASGGWRWLSLAQSAGGALVGAAFIYGIGVLYMAVRQRAGMGLGDVKLMAMIGSFLGPALTVFTLFAASFAASLVGLGTMLLVWLRRTRRRMRKMREPAPTARRRAWRSAMAVYGRFQIPFGVFLGAMALLAAFFGNALLWWYWFRFL